MRRPASRSTVLRGAVVPATALAAAALGLAGCGGATGIELEHAKRAAAACAARAGVEASASPLGPAVGNEAKPFYAAPVVGVSGDPPTALGYGDPRGGSAVTFAVVPAASNPSRSTTFADVTATDAQATFLSVPAAKAVETERCLGGSAPG